MESIQYDVDLKHHKQSIYRIVEENPSSTALGEVKTNGSYHH